MDSPSTAALRIKKLTPRHVEIMERMICGQTPKVIAQEMGISQGRLSIITNSPLFILALKRKLAKREVKFLEIQEEILEGAVRGLELHKKMVIEDNPMEMKLRSATVLAGLAMKLFPLKGLTPQEESGGNGGGSYEERLREVTMKETVRISQKKDEKKGVDPDISKLLESEYPPEAGLMMNEEDELFGEVDEDDEFEPFAQTEKLLPNKGDSS